MTRNFLTPPTSPAAILREDVIPALGRTLDDLACAIGISREQFENILNEEKEITPEITKKLAKVFGGGGVWLKMQKEREDWFSKNSP